MKNKMKLGVCGALLVSSLVGGALETGDLVAHAASNDINSKVTQQVVGQFKDVTKSHYAYDAINFAKDRGIIQGYPDGTFKPNEPITEAQFAKMLAEFLGLKDDKGDLVKATSASHWADSYYDSLASYNTPLNAYFDNALRNKTVKRGVVAQAISHLTGNANSLADSINYMIGAGVTTGQNPQYEGKDLNKFFGSQNNLTRAQVAAFLYRMHNIDIEEATGIAIVANKNAEGLSLVGQANKGMSKLDSSLRLGKLGSETPSTGGGNNNGGNTKPPEETKPDFSNAKLPVSSSASSKDVDVNELNKVASKLSSGTIDLFEKNGYEVTNAHKGALYTNPFGLTISSDSSSSVKVNFNYDDGTDLEFVKSLVKDLSGVTLTDADLSKNTRVEIGKVVITKSNSGRDITILK